MSERIEIEMGALDRLLTRAAALATAGQADAQAKAFSDQIGPTLARIEHRLSVLEARCRVIEDKLQVIPVAEYLPRG